MFQKSQNFRCRNITCIFLKKIVHVGKKLEAKLQYFDGYLYDKNILEYVQILVTGGKFMIFDIEGHPNKLLKFYWSCPP